MTLEHNPPPESKEKLKESLSKEIEEEKKMTKTDNSGGMKQYAAMALIALAVSIAVSTYMGNNTTSTLTAMKDTIASTQNDIKTSRDALNTAINGIPASVSSQVSSAVNSAVSNMSSQINNALTNANNASNQANSAVNSVNSIKSTLDGMNTALTKDTTDIGTMQSQLAGYETRIKALEDKLITPAKTSAVTVKVATMGSALLPSNADNYTSLTTSVRLDLTNNTAVKVDDVILDIVIGTNVPLSTISSVSLTGGNVAWQSTGTYWSTNEMEFRNTQWGLNIDANATKKLYLTFTVSGNVNGVYRINGIPQSYPYQVDASVED